MYRTESAEIVAGTNCIGSKLYHEHSVSGTNCEVYCGFENNLYRKQIVSVANAVGNKRYRKQIVSAYFRDYSEQLSTETSCETWGHAQSPPPTHLLPV